MAAGEELEKSAGNLLQHLFGPWVTEQGLIWQENVRVRRLKNQFKILGKVKDVVEEEGVHIRDVNLKALAPLLEGISLEEEPTLQELWKNLTINYLDSSVTTINIVYPHILKSLSTNEVKFLKWLQDHNSGINTTIKNPDVDFEIHEVNNLERLSLIVEDIRYFTQPKHGLSEVNWEHTNVFFLSEFGKDFLKACHRK